MKISNVIKIFIPIVLLVLTEILVITKISSDISDSNLYNETVDDALSTIKQYKEIRSYYNESVISKLSNNPYVNIDIKHKASPNTIPHSATFIHDLSERLNKKLDGMQVKVYSDYPFPNRSGRVLDSFEKSSIEHFRGSLSREPIISHENKDGIEVIRVAIADKMNNKSCIECHNSMVNTPKRDWKLGDVRGVLEVVIPIKQQIEHASTVIHYIDMTMIIAGIIHLIIIYFIISYFSKIERQQQDTLNKEQYKLSKSVSSFDENVIASNSDLDGFITYASKALCEISGYTQKELLGRPHNILRHPDMPKEVFKELWEEIQKENKWEGEIKNKKKNGQAYWVRTTVMPDYDYEDNLIGYTSIRHDITAQKVKEEFFSNMSHELRTPLNAIVGFVGILNKQISDKKHKNYLSYISSNSHHLLSLINDILDLSKIKSGDFSIELHEGNAYAELSEYSCRFEGMLSEKYITFTSNIDNNLKGIYLADWLRISQIILNLVSNAIKFTPQDGTISVDAGYRDGALVLVVTDNGIGMSPAVQNKVFKPFVQADGSTTRKYGGTGLGLSITHKLIEMMDGQLKLQSQEGKGSSFSVIIPMQKLSSDITAYEEIASDETTNSLLSGNILVAEDNKTNQLLIRLLLEDLGVDCDIADDGAKALEMYDPSVYDLIIMDENMPNMNGITAMHKIRDKHKDKCGPIIAFTANVMEGDKERFLKEGMDDYLSKPVNEAELYNVLKKFLKKRD